MCVRTSPILAPARRPSGPLLRPFLVRIGGMDQAYVWDYTLQIPLWLVVPFLLAFCWAGWKLISWAIAALR